MTVCLATRVLFLRVFVCYMGYLQKRDTEFISAKPEPIMLLILPIILSRISHIFHPLFFIYSHAITYYSIIISQI